MVLTTRDRPRFLQIALRCYEHQTYPNRELIVIDDGTRHPVDEGAIANLGGELIRVPDNTPLGTKLNIGIEAASGPLCQKMDDDDWYGPEFVETMVRTVQGQQHESCEPFIAFVTPFLFFNVAAWEVRRSRQNNVPGATLLFDREDWFDRPFRSVRRDEDVWFVHEQMNRGRTAIPVPLEHQYLAVRHTGMTGDRGHTWTHQGGHGKLDDYIQQRPLNAQQPETILPRWAITAYSNLRADITSGV